MKNLKLHSKEKEDIKTFVFQFTKLIQKLQDCENYLEVKNAVNKMNVELQESKWANNFDVLCNRIENKLDE